MNQSLNHDRDRNHLFPVVNDWLFWAHAGVSVLPQVARDALITYAHHASANAQEDEAVWKEVGQARSRAAELIGAHPSEIALLGPTALGLSLVANGWPWETDDEVVYYADDYPANVYPWLALKDRGVKPVPLPVERLGEVTWEAVERALTPRTRMVALASCHYLTGYRIDIDTIGKNLRERGVLFCLDGIQTLGAYPTSVKWVDFLSADSHKWMLGPVGAGIVYVRAEHHERLRPTLLGAWNVRSPDFVAQSDIAYYDGARRYEPGSLNIPGIYAMSASLGLLLETGIERIASRIGQLHERINREMLARGFAPPECMRLAGAEHRSGIISFTHPSVSVDSCYRTLAEKRVRVSMRQSRAGTPFLRCSPHFYNTSEEIDRFLRILDREEEV